MYLSTLFIDTGTDPDRPRPGRLWLRNLYRVHQRLCMAFPSKARKDQDGDMLRPFTPADFAQAHVHVPRNGTAGFLFRVDPHRGASPTILVLSATEPDWECAFHNAQYLLSAPPQTKPFAPAIAAGQRWRFLLLANAIFRARAQSLHGSGDKIRTEWVGKRVGVAANAPALHAWIERRGDKAGFRITQLMLAQPGYVYMNKTGQAGQGQRLRSVRYGGVLEVTDAAAFRQTLISGIGPAKAFGFGLLSIAPAASGP